MYYLTTEEIKQRQGVLTQSDVLYALERFESTLKGATEAGIDVSGIYDHQRAFEVRIRLMGIPAQLLGSKSAVTN